MSVQCWPVSNAEQADVAWAARGGDGRVVTHAPARTSNTRRSVHPSNQIRHHQKPQPRCETLSVNRRSNIGDLLVYSANFPVFYPNDC